MKYFPIFPYAMVMVLGASANAQSPVSVQVVDSENRPIVGATVEVSLFNDPENPTFTSALTKNDGTAKFSLPPHPKSKEVAGFVTAAAKGYAAASIIVEGATVKIELNKGAIWRGKVADEKGNPISGAKVNVRGASRNMMARPLFWLSGPKIIDSYTSISGADGSFSIDGLPPGISLNYSVEHPKFAGIRGQDMPVDSEETIKLKPGGSLHGRLLNADGQPLPKVRIYAGSIPMGVGGNSGTTDDKGFFTVDGLGTGNYKISAQLKKGVDYVLPPLSPVRVEAGKVKEVAVIRAQKGKEIRGAVLDAVSKKPIANASVMATVDNETSAYTTTDVNGKFVMYVLPGKYKVHMPGAPSGYLRPDVQPTINVSATPGQPLIFALKKAPQIRIVTIDETGKPISAVLSVDRGGQISTDKLGKLDYTLNDAGPLTFGGGEDTDGYFEVVGDDKFEPPIRDTVVVKVRKKPWTIVTGRAITTEGNPLPRTKISIYVSIPMGDGMSLGSTRNVVTNEQGKFVLDKLRDNSLKSVSGEKSGFTLTAGGKIGRGGTSRTAEDLVFSALNRKIEGTTAPQANVVVVGRETIADAGGKFVFEGLPAGDLAVYA
ncbi:carboxypeptidase regulatory-like domain-containing protein, partial [bacterium]